MGLFRVVYASPGGRYFVVAMGSQLTDSFITSNKYPSVLGVWYILNRFGSLPLYPETPRPRRPAIRTSLTTLAFHPQHFLPQFLLSTHTAVCISELGCLWSPGIEKERATALIRGWRPGKKSNVYQRLRGALLANAENQGSYNGTRHEDYFQ